MEVVWLGLGSRHFGFASEGLRSSVYFQYTSGRRPPSALPKRRSPSPSLGWPSLRSAAGDTFGSGAGRAMSWGCCYGLESFR